jgi:hypothetical protein
MVRGKRSYRNGLTAVKCFLVLSIAAFMTRILPLSMSQYPFNNDSLTECEFALNILNSGHLGLPSGEPWYGTHGGSTPILHVLLAFTSSTLGVSPFQCAQFLDAIVAVLTIGCLFLLGRFVSGSLRGGVAASFAAILMGTFVFTTGSVWDEMLGISFLAFALLAFVLRKHPAFRVLVFSVLMLMPLVDRLVAIVALLAFAYLVAWSWFFRLSTGAPKRRYLEDLVTIAVPIIWAVIFYASVEPSQVSGVSFGVKMMLLGASFVLISIVAVLILSIQNHFRRTLAPIVAVGLFAIITLDYMGYLFSYTPSVSDVYFLLAASSAFLFGLAWYGAEVILETRPSYRAIQVALIVSPLSVMGFGMLNGFSLPSHQIVYRTFDFIDIFIFLGLGVAIVWLYNRHRKAYHIVGFLTIVCLLVSFPFAYESEGLLGVRHDTQGYEIDSAAWISEHADSPLLFSDERLGYIAESTYGLPRYASLPSDLKRNVTLSDKIHCLVEDNWVSQGVNVFPYGKVKLPENNYTWILESANVFYIGGPENDRAIMFMISPWGAFVVYNPGVWQ